MFLLTRVRSKPIRARKGGQSVSRKGAAAPSTPKPEVKGSDPPEKKPNKACFYCKKEGHMMPELSEI